MDLLVMAEKLEFFRRCLKRIEDKCPEKNRRIKRFCREQNTDFTAFAKAVMTHYGL